MKPISHSDHFRDQSPPLSAETMRELERKMKILASELKAIANATSVDKDYFEVLPPTGNPSEDQETQKALYNLSMMQLDPTVKASRSTNKNIYRAASALLAVYDELGAIPLALTVASVRDAVHRKSSPKFEPEVIKVLSRSYSPTELGPSVPDATSSAIPSSINRREAMIGAGALAVSGLTRLWMGHSKQETHTAKDKAEEEAINLESETVLTKEQKKQLLALQKITIPKLTEDMKTYDSWVTYSNWAVGGSAVLTLFGLFSDRFKPGVKSPNNTENPYNIGNTLETLDGVLADACANRKPDLNNFPIPRR
jgi:hypothetical protein